MTKSITTILKPLLQGLAIGFGVANGFLMFARMKSGMGSGDNLTYMVETALGHTSQSPMFYALGSVLSIIFVTILIRSTKHSAKREPPESH